MSGLYPIRASNILLIFTQHAPVITRSVFSIRLTKCTHSSPSKASYGVSFCEFKVRSMLYQHVVVLYTRSCSMGPRFVGSQRYISPGHVHIIYIYIHIYIYAMQLMEFWQRRMKELPNDIVTELTHNFIPYKVMASRVANYCQQL